MPLGMAKGMNLAAFLKAVKSLRVVFIDGRGIVATGEVPIEHFRVPIFNYQLRESDERKNQTRYD
jgi:hypothetical protein